MTASLLHRWTTEALFVDEFDVLERERGLAVLNLPGTAAATAPGCRAGSTSGSTT